MRILDDFRTRLRSNYYEDISSHESAHVRRRISAESAILLNIIIVTIAGGYHRAVNSYFSLRADRLITRAYFFIRANDASRTTCSQLLFRLVSIARRGDPSWFLFLWQIMSGENSFVRLINCFM
jgi:hypothetical protein